MRTSHARALGALLLVAAIACADDPSAPALPTEGAIVSFAFNGLPQDTMRVHMLHEPSIAQAEQYVATQQGSRMPVGPIVRGAGVDPRYPFHYVAAEVRMAQLAIELCDGRPMRTPQAVNQFIAGSTGNASAPQATWCPWGAYPVSVQRLGD